MNRIKKLLYRIGVVAVAVTVAVGMMTSVGFAGEGGTTGSAANGEQVAKIMKALSTKSEYAKDSSWVFGLYASGGRLTASDRETYLEKVRGDMDLKDAGTLAKDVLSLSAMGLDPQKIKDAAGNEHNILADIYEKTTNDLGMSGVYAASYALLAYDSCDYRLPENAKLDRETLIKYILKAQEKDGSWGSYVYAGQTFPGTPGDTASVAQALVRYSNRSDVKKALDKADAFIDKNISSDAGNTNSLSYLVVYKTMRGEDPWTIKADAAKKMSLAECFLGFALDDGTFRFGESEGTNGIATVDAFRAVAALARFEESRTDGAGIPVNIYELSHRVYATVSDADGKIIAKADGLEINAGKDTVFGVLKEILEKQGKPYTLNATGDYVESIDGVGEMEKGPNSGWMYRVNDKIPQVPAASYVLNGGEKVEWFYAEDWRNVPGTEVTADADKVKETVKGITLSAKASLTAAKKVKLTAKLGSKSRAAIAELKKAGYTVKYRFYASKKKLSGYKTLSTKKAASYTGKSRVQSKKYYKIQVRVYDENGKLIAKTALKQCKAARA